MLIFPKALCVFQDFFTLLTLPLSLSSVLHHSKPLMHTDHLIYSAKWYCLVQIVNLIVQVLTLQPSPSVM